MITLTSLLEENISNIDINSIKWERPHYVGPNEVEIEVDVKKVDDAWSKNTETYIGAGGTGNVKRGSYQGFKDFLQRGWPIEMAQVHWGDYTNTLGFTNGRHRFAVLRDMGLKRIPVLIPKNQIKFFQQNLSETFNKVSDLLSNKENNEKTIYQLLDDFKEHGGEILGQGKYATVLFHPSWKYVIKIFSSDVPYLKFVRFCIKNPRKSFPVFYDKPRRIIPNYKRHKSNTYLYVVKTEKLLPINIKEYDDMQYYLNYDKENSKVMMDKYQSDEWAFIYNKLVKLESEKPWIIQFKEDYNFLMSGNYDIGTPDIHSKNIMKRDNGEFVLADPFWVGENPYQTYDRLLKAEIGYDDDEYEDPEKDMVKGGEKYKKPPVVKKTKPIYSPTEDDDIPF